MTELGLTVFFIFLILVLFITLFVHIKCSQAEDNALLCSLMYGVAYATFFVFVVVLICAFLAMAIGEGTGILGIFYSPASTLALFLALILLAVSDRFAPAFLQ